MQSISSHSGGGKGAPDPNGMERLPGESDADYIADIKGKIEETVREWKVTVYEQEKELRKQQLSGYLHLQPSHIPFPLHGCTSFNRW